MNASQPITTSGQTEIMRRLLNILAVIIGVVSGLAGLAGAFAAFGAVWALLSREMHFPADWTGVIVLGLGAGVAFIGFLIASRALLHLRHPDAGTVRDMIGTAIYLIVMAGVLPLGRKLHAPGSLLLAVIGLYVFHRYLVKRINAEAFPAPESHA